MAGRGLFPYYFPRDSKLFINFSFSQSSFSPHPSTFFYTAFSWPSLSNWISFWKHLNHSKRWIRQGKQLWSLSPCCCCCWRLLRPLLLVLKETVNLTPPCFPLFLASSSSFSLLTILILFITQDISLSHIDTHLSNLELTCTSHKTRCTSVHSAHLAQSFKSATLPIQSLCSSNTPPQTPSQSTHLRTPALWHTLCPVYV